MVIPININWHEIIPPVSAGVIVSLLNKWIFNNQNLLNMTCCQEIEAEVMDDESDNSGRTIASVDTVNPHVHVVHASTIPHFTH